MGPCARLEVIFSQAEQLEEALNRLKVIVGLSALTAGYSPISLLGARSQLH